MASQSWIAVIEIFHDSFRVIVLLLDSPQQLKRFTGQPFQTRIHILNQQIMIMIRVLSFTIMSLIFIDYDNDTTQT